MQKQKYDVVVVGGGPAGLSAALWLARYLHDVVVVDSGDPRNWETRGVNGFLGHQGIRSPELRKLGRSEGATYGVDFVAGIVDTAENENGDLFVVKLRDGATMQAKRILLAIVIKESRAAVRGVGDCNVDTGPVCLDCDGYETRAKKTVVIGTGRKAVGM